MPCFVSNKQQFNNDDNNNNNNNINTLQGRDGSNSQ